MLKRSTGLGIGNLIGITIFSLYSDKAVKRKAISVTNSDGNVTSYTKPEVRLPPMVLGALLLPASLFIYGWTARYKIMYIVPIFGTLLFGISSRLCDYIHGISTKRIIGVSIFTSIQTYLVDAFGVYAARLEPITNRPPK